MKNRILLAMVLLVSVSTAGEGVGETRNIAIVIYDGVEVLDFAGPAEVLEIASAYGRAGEVNAFRLYTVAPSGTPVTSQNFLRVIPDYIPSDAPAPDILIIPGGRTGALLNDEQFMKWADRVMEKAITMTVCSGATVPAKLGRLDGRRATTWYGLVDRMVERYPETRFEHGLRLVDDGTMITTAGVSAGIDGALHLVARLLGLQVAMETATYMEYEWAPAPYLVGSYPFLNPILDASGRAVQVGTLQMRSGDPAGATKTYRAALRDGPESPDLWHALFAALSKMEQWDQAVEASLEVARSNPIRGYYNAACAAARGGDVERALESLHRSIEAGFDNRAWMERDEDLESLRGNPRFETLLTMAAPEN